MEFILEIIKNIQPEFIEWITRILEHFVQELNNINMIENNQEDNASSNFVLNSLKTVNNINSEFFKNNNVQININDNYDLDMDTLTKMEQTAYILANDALSKEDRIHYSKKFYKYLQTVSSNQLFKNEKDLLVYDSLSTINTLNLIIESKRKRILETEI